MQDKIIGLILILRELKKISLQEKPHFYKRLFQSKTKGQSGSKYSTFPVTIGNEKGTGEIEYYPKDPLVEYHQNYSNVYCFSSLASAFTLAGKKNSAKDIAAQIEE